MRNLSNLNDIYNVQEVIILTVILKYSCQKIKDDISFNPRCFTSASTLSSAIERIKSVEKVKVKQLNKELYALFKQEDLNSSIKPISIHRFNGETESHKRRVFSKIFKQNENNQYGSAMTKPVSIGIFKQEV